MKTYPNHIHVPQDGRGQRSVTLNGKEVKAAFADTKKGKVVIYDEPLKLHKHCKRLVKRTRYGAVSVVFRNGGIR